MNIRSVCHQCCVDASVQTLAKAGDQLKKHSL